MDTQQLLSASVLDIIFEGRNKEYGAYCLRKEYNGRLKKAMLTTGAIAGLIILMLSFKRNEETINWSVPVSDTLAMIMPPEKQPEIVIPPKPAAPPPMVRTVQFTSPPKIVSDKDVRPDDVPPENNSLDHVKIDLFTQDGPEVDFATPPQGTSNGVIGNLIGGRSNEDSAFIPIEVESTFPGGPKAWARFLNKTFIYPQAASDNGIEGTVKIKFIVDVNGNVSNVEVINGPEELRPEAIRVIKKSGKWNPAIQNGRMVKSYKQQDVTFKLAQE